MNEDIKLLDTIVGMRKKDLMYTNYFSWLYPFTNENIKGYYSNLDFQDKSVLTVTSSGDHILNALLYGAKTVEAFDANPLAKYYVELKIAAIKALDIEEFLLFFYNKNIFLKYKYHLNKKSYKKVRKELKDDYLIFWDYVFEKYTPKDLYKSILFTSDYLEFPALIEANPYLHTNNFNQLKIILKNKSICYHDKDLKELSNINKKYDLIILSNIPAFLEKIYREKRLAQLKDILEVLKKDESKIVLNYFYYNRLNDVENNSDIYDKKEVKRLFVDYEYREFESTENLSMNRIKRKLYPKKDCILVSKDKQSK